MSPESLPIRVRRTFDEDGDLAAGFEGFEPRPGQRRLAGEVARVFTSGGTLVAEAGTGTGKTLAYLVPAVLANRRVLISTGTRTLQDQIFYKDLPALGRALGLEIKAAYMKGRSNYLCLHRFARLREAEAGLSSEEQRWLRQISEWAAETPTGDRSEIEDLPDEFPLWMDLSSTSEQCLGRDCPEYNDCFIKRMRDRAADANVVIVNHHLLCADASVRQGDFGEVIPECELAVIDEAHQLEDVVTQYFGVSLSTYRIEELRHDAERAIGSLAIEHGQAAGAMEAILSEIEYAARGLFDQARIEQRRGEGGGDRTTVTGEIAIRLQTEAAGLSDALDRLALRVRSVPGAPAELVAIGVRADGMRDDLRVLVAADDANYVHFIEVRGRGVFLRAAPIDASAIIRDAVLSPREATVLTSATLTVEGSFDYALSRLGAAEAATLRMPSEFDYRTQAILFLPKQMPDPRSPEFNRAAAGVIVELLERTNGRAFVLFTSYSAMRDVHARLAPHLRWPMLMQGQAPRTALLRDFRATPNAVLLATSSFWQGVDVAGDALSCVIIDRLPFASPGDPLVAARIAAITARGGHAFHEYQVPLATLTLLQGLGRLIRTRSDRGVLAVLDPRLTRMSYGRRFLSSLPPAPMTDDLDDIEAFFREP